MAQQKDFTQTMNINRDDLEALIPTAPAAVPTAPAKIRTRDGRTQITYKLPDDLIEKVKAISFWDRCDQWQFVADAIRAAVEKYEEEHGTTPPIPRR